MIYKYAFEIRPINSIIENHSQLLSPDFSIIADVEDDMPLLYLFTSLHLNDLTDPVQIWRRGLFILNLYKGACMLAVQNPDNVAYVSRLAFSRLYDLKANTSITVPHTAELIPSNSFSENVLNSPVPLDFTQYKNYPICNRIFEARTNNSMRNLLLQLANGLSWINLYAILDSLWHYAKPNGKKHYNSILQKAGFDQKEEKRFTGTANNFGLLGTLARHGDLGYQSPASTMTLTEAQDFIIRLSNTFIENTYKC